jgi:DNA modification methylase
MEIDPKFVDVAIRRWQTFTGRDAVLRASGETFTEVAEIRSRSTDAVRRRR